MRPLRSVEIAREMLTSPCPRTVQVGDGLEPRDVAASIQTSLSSQHVYACWLHARERFDVVLRFACNHQEVPLVVTTDQPDWRGLERDRAWHRRRASIAFVLPRALLPTIPPQVDTMLKPGSVVVRCVLAIHKPIEARKLATQTRKLMMRLALSLPEIKIVATDTYLPIERVSWAGSVETIALDLLDLILQCDKLEEFVQHLHTRHEHEEVATLLRVIRDLYASS